MNAPVTRLGRLAALRRRTFRSLRHRDYRRYFAGQIVSFTGSWAQSTALMWLVFDRTADPLWPPLMLCAAVGPTLFLGPVGGALADHIPKRTLVLGTQTAFLLHAVALAVLVGTGVVGPWGLFAFQLLSGCIQAIDLPARLAFVPDLIPRDDLINAVGLNSLLFNAARAVGPGLAGLLFLLVGDVTGGAVCCFLLNAVSYAAVLLALARIQAGRGGGRKTGEPPGSFWDGFRYVAGHPGLLSLVILTGAFSVFAWPALTLLPAYTRLHLGLAEKAYSGLLSGLGAGALVGAVATAGFGSEKRRERFLLIGVGCGTLGLAGLATVTTLPAAIGCAAVIGFGLILYLSTGQSTLQLSAPDRWRGKVMALWAMTLSASSLPGHLLAGRLAQELPVWLVLAGMTAGVAAVGLGLVGLVRSGRLSREASRAA